MAESFENLDNILHDWAKNKAQKSIVDALNRYEKHSLARRRKIKPFRFQKMTQKKYSIASCATFLFLPHFDVICDLLLNRRTATWNLFVKLRPAIAKATLPVVRARLGQI